MKPIITTKITYVLKDVERCSRCGAIYFRETKCYCPNLEIKYLTEELEKSKGVSK